MHNYGNKNSHDVIRKGWDGGGGWTGNAYVTSTYYGRNLLYHPCYSGLCVVFVCYVCLELEYCRSGNFHVRKLSYDKFSC